MRRVSIVMEHNGVITRDVVLASVIGPFAIHPGVTGAACQWTLTHRPSGLRMASYPNRSQAQAVANALSRMDIDWSTAIAGYTFADSVAMERRRQIRVIVDNG